MMCSRSLLRTVAVYIAVVMQGLFVTAAHAEAVSPLAKQEVAPASGKLVWSQDEKGRWGAKNDQGQTVLPFMYDLAQKLGDGYMLIAQQTGNSDSYKVGVLNDQGGVVLPMTYSGVDYYREHQRFRVARGEGEHRLVGFLDTSGKVVVPLEYDYLERISNAGDEPTHMARRNGQWGYVNFVTGKVLIAPHYDALRIEGLHTDAQGEGLAMAQKHGKWGIITTRDKVLVPFDYDKIDGFYRRSWAIYTPYALASRAGQRVQLNFNEDHAYTGSSAALEEKPAEVTGIGAGIRKPAGQVRVMMVVPDSAAATAGLQAGDAITHVDGESVQTWTEQEALLKLRGPIGTRVQVRYERDGESHEVTLTRKRVVAPVPDSASTGQENPVP